jgi:Ca2+-dependent lipid-binding protein
MPASVQKVYKQLYFKFIKAEHLPIMDLMGTIDAYIYLEYNGSKIRTKTYTMKDNLVIWNQEILIPLELPASNDTLVFNLYDYDKPPLPDTLCASMTFSLKQIIQQTDSSNNAPGDFTYHMQWINLFGCNPEYSGSQADS